MDIKWHLERALNGVDRKNLNAVSFIKSGDIIDIFFYFKTPPSNQEVEAVQIVASELSADLPFGTGQVNETIISAPPSLSDLASTQTFVFKPD